MNGVTWNMRYIDWLREYEKNDPEPVLTVQIKDQYEHITPQGKSLGNGWHYSSQQVLEHLAWHHRMTKEYMIVKDDLEN